MTESLFSECKQEDLGLGDGRIPMTSVTVSSEDSAYPKSQLGDGKSKTSFDSLMNQVSVNKPFL